ncbi:MAG TPA: glucosamine-6-phosphate isomerase, partial [Ruminococcaceae bacterium]|nr:glucosamine-6-phosphate isomerase [Oscillospiraceae bacterium]
MDFISTVKGSLLEDFYPAAWDMVRIDECCEKGVEREDFWHEDFTPIECESLSDF